MHLIRSRSVLSLLLVGAFVALRATSAQAGSVIGSQTFSIDATSLDTSSVATATVFNFTGIATQGSNDGDFTGISSGLLINSGTEVLTTPFTFTFGNAIFGTFTATSLVSDTGNSLPKFRSIELSGIFSGGSLFPGQNDPTPAGLAISLTQSGGPGRPISASFSLVTSPIPEPASVVMMGVGLVGALGLSRLRRKTA
jgi:hypothetical protein